MNRFFDALGKISGLPKYLKNPQDNPQLAAIALGIFVIIGLIVVAALLLLYLRASTPKKIKIAVKKHPRRLTPKRLAIIFGVLVFCSLLLTTVQSRSPKFCMKCHVNERVYKTWAKSQHKNVACFKCHQSSGPLGYAEYMARGLSNLKAFFSRSWPEPIKTAINDNNCLSCHEATVNKVIESKGVRVSHKEFLIKGAKCSDCHAATGHEQVTNPVKTPQMGQCLNCHDDKQASAKCETCHVQDVAKSARTQKRTYLKAQTREMTTCNGCHTIKTRNDCISCMGFEMPHPPGWAPDPLTPAIFKDKQPAIHAPIAFKNFEKCMKCHSTQYFCNNCHRFPAEGKRNHGPEWLQGHQQVGNKTASCSCHAVSARRNWCEFCHGKNLQRKNPGDMKYYFGPPAE